ncbi:unnamed protein product [Phaedon cochleariae]|uniref:Uncharacterized protein n=1 Tax=Phaedon cochleariae TaxID=80249 RepID=A0A9P0DUG9_PHACE|nr:unnamed protein product [Phaedon cochleariae]
MGLSASKIGKHVSEEEFHEGSVPTTPILTPKIEKISNILDPRSPSANISRTPLEILTAAAKRLQNFEENQPIENVNNDTPLRSKPCLLEIDPRSPTTDFTRTPIILNVNEKSLPRLLHNKNLDKVRLAEINMPLSSSNNESTVTKTEDSLMLPQTKSPILLESSPIKYKTDPYRLAYRRKSFVGLLETNIDFTETDLDVVMQTKCTMIQEGDNSSPFENEPNDENLDALRVMKADHEELSNELAVISSASASQIETNKETLNDDIVPDKIDCEQRDLQNLSLDDESFEPKKIVNCMNIQSSQEKELNVDTASRDKTEDLIVQIANESKSAPMSPPSPILVTKESKSAPVSPPTVNITATIKELDQKLTNLIYEDDIIVCPRIVKLKEPIERSPLKNRNGSEPLRSQKLKVSDKPRKSDYVVSKIPIFKEKGRKEIQCENTPPRMLEMKKGKLKKCNWDNTDTTLYL